MSEDRLHDAPPVPDDELPVDDEDLDDPVAPLDVPFETPDVDAFEQREVVPLDDDHDPA
jgi:hypothetical protein